MSNQILNERPMHPGRLGIFLIAMALAGCQSVGPATVPRDRSDYSQAISDSWKSQMLLNIVKLRYADVPIFVDVGQIVAGYSLETSVNAAAQFVPKSSLLGNTTNLGVQGKYTDRPTITYVPLSGGKFMQELLTPIPPAAIFKAIQSGWPADTMLWLGVASINGVRNTRSGSDGAEESDPRFERVAFLMRKAQLSGALGIRVRPQTRGSGDVVVTIRNREAPPESLADLEELRQLLGLRAGVDEFPLELADVPSAPDELAVQTRTLFGILQSLALRVDVPVEHIREGRAGAGLAPAPQEVGRLHFQVASAKSRPADAAVAVTYRDRYFYVDDRDLGSKRAFAMIMMLFTLANTGPESNLPVLTIPAN
jgi:hypothetical protein